MPLVGPDGQPLSQEKVAQMLKDAREAAPQGVEEPVENPPEPQGPVPCTTAFIVFLSPQGNVLVTDDLNAPLVPERKPLLDELSWMTSMVHEDAQAQKISNGLAQALAQTLQPLPSVVAQQVIQQQMNMARQAMEARNAEGVLNQQAQAEAAKLETALRRR